MNTITGKIKLITDKEIAFLVKELHTSGNLAHRDCPFCDSDKIRVKMNCRRIKKTPDSSEFTGVKIITQVECLNCKAEAPPLDYVCLYWFKEKLTEKEYKEKLRKMEEKAILHALQMWNNREYDGDSFDGTEFQSTFDKMLEKFKSLF
jgi:hypothetical protein